MAFDLELVRSVRPQNQLYYFETIGSTMTEAARLAQEGAPHGTTVLAEEQVAGLGRLGRTWQSPKGVGLYCSILLRLPIAPANLPVASLLLGLAVADAIQKTAEVPCDLRWPNDVLVNECKVAGILPQLISGCVTGGIGINVNNQSFPEGLRTPATSLALASGRPVSRERLFLHLLQSVDLFCGILLADGVPAIVNAFSRASSYVFGRQVTIEETGVQGRTAGLDENGFLLLQTEAGQFQRITSGGVRAAV